MTSQHNALSNALSGQVATHDGAQTSEHDALSDQISNLPTGAGVGRCDVPPVWGATITTGRFVSVFGEAAYCDQETGLVWEQAPLTTAHEWSPARVQCMGRTVGGRKGWRLPSVHELASLVDPGNPGSNPDLPVDHPFTDVRSSSYWSASTSAESPTLAWLVDFSDGVADTFDKTHDISVHVWCVRGGMNADAC